MNRSEIDDRFLYYPPELRNQVADFRRTGNPALIDPILDAVLRKYVPEAFAATVEDPVIPLGAFGLDSLTLIEVVLDLQDAFGLQLSEEELRSLGDLDQARALLVAKARALPGAAVP